MMIKHEHYNVSCFHTTIYIDIIAQLQTITSLINQIQMLLSLCTYSSMKLVVMQETISLESLQAAHQDFHVHCCLRILPDNMSSIHLPLTPWGYTPTGFVFLSHCIFFSQVASHPSQPIVYVLATGALIFALESTSTKHLETGPCQHMDHCMMDSSFHQIDSSIHTFNNVTGT